MFAPPIRYCPSSFATAKQNAMYMLTASPPPYAISSIDRTPTHINAQNEIDTHTVCCKCLHPWCQLFPVRLMDLRRRAHDRWNKLTRATRRLSFSSYHGITRTHGIQLKQNTKSLNQNNHLPIFWIFCLL